MELRFGELYNTVEYRNHFHGLAAAQFFAFILTVILVIAIAGLISREIDGRLYSVIALLEKNYPGSASRVIPLFTGEIDEKAVAEGKRLIAPYGYSGIPLSSKPLISALLVPVTILTLILSLLSVALNLLVFRKHERKLFCRLSELSDCILSVLNGKTSYGETRYEEGIFDRLVTRFNQMVKRLEGSAELLRKEKGFLRDIISDISHQLKTPMSSLIMYNDLMLKDSGMDVDTREGFLENCRGQLNRMEWLVISLLKLARLETGSITFRKTEVDVLASLETAIQNLKHLRGNRRLILSDKREGKNRLKGDPDWLAEAFSNIIKNAYEHTAPDEGEINIAIKDTALFLRIVIRDNGPGISDADLPRIFDRFYKGGNSVAMESVGIGLPLSRMIFRAQGGDIRAEGSSFAITLPY